MDKSLPATRVTRTLDMLASWRLYPQQLRLDNGPELISNELARWAERHAVKLAFIQPGKPAQNGFIERFNRTFREAILDAYLFNSLEEVRAITDDWVEVYNTVRPHGAVGGLSPFQFAINHSP